MQAAKPCIAISKINFLNLQQKKKAANNVNTLIAAE
jgi:hypothetical protein